MPENKRFYFFYKNKRLENRVIVNGYQLINVRVVSLQKVMITLKVGFHWRRSRTGVVVGVKALPT